MIDLYGTDDSFDELDRPPSKFGTEQSESKASVPCQSGEKRGIVMAEETNFYDEARRLGIDTQSIPNEYWKPETVRGFMVGDSGPYVDALDYLWLLDRSKQ